MVLEAMRNNNARDAGAALHAYANQQQFNARQSRNQNLAATARVNITAANAMQGPAGQRMMENALNTSVGHGKTVRDMLNSNNPNNQNLAAAYVCNTCAGQGRYARNNMQGLQLASKVEHQMEGRAPFLGLNRQPQGIQGGDHASAPQPPVPQGGAPQPPAPRRGIW
jgi:hypothetical protein